MSLIQDCLNKIKNAVFGEEVRQSIIDSINQCYKDATGHPESVASVINEIENVKQEQAELSSEIDENANRISSIVAQAGTDNTEIVDMRTVNETTYTTSGDALRAVSSGKGIKDKAININKLDDTIVEILGSSYGSDKIKSTIFECESSDVNAYPSGINFFVIPNYKINKNKEIKTITLYALNSGDIDICIFTGEPTKLKLIKKINKTVTIGINILQINYSFTEDIYIGFKPNVDGACSYLKEVADTSFYKGVYYAYDIRKGHVLAETEEAEFSIGPFQVIFNFKVDLETISEKYLTIPKLSSEIEILKKITDNTAGLNYVCFGDSITSDEFSGIGTIINSKLKTNLVGNFANGNAHCSDWHNGDTNDTIIKFDTLINSNTNDNVLSNQIRRLLRHVTPLGEQIKWTHPIDGEFSLDTSIGLGLGNIDDIPDIIYIAIGTNDGKTIEGYNPSPTIVIDDTEIVFSQTYSQLTRTSIASALRWAIETLISKFPSANIFIASPLVVNNILCTTMPNAFSYETEKLKRNIIKKVCEYENVNFIDSFNCSGFSYMVAKKNGGLHPNEKWTENIASFVTKEIKNNFLKKI